MRTSNFITFTFFLLLSFSIVSCATIFKGKETKTFFDSKPTGAKVYIDGEFKGETPLNLSLISKGQYEIEFVKEGSRSKTYIMKRSVEPIWVVLDILLTLGTYGIGIIGIVIDGYNGAWYTLNPDKITTVFDGETKEGSIELEKLGESKGDISPLEEPEKSSKEQLTEGELKDLEDQSTDTTTKKIRDKILKTSIVEFSEKGELGIKDAGSIVADWMTTALNKTKAFEVYERLSIQELLKEYKLGESGMLDAKTVAKIGKMRGVQAIITGSVIKFGDVISVTTKLIDVETAKIIATGDLKVFNINEIPLKIDQLAYELAKE